MRWGIEIKTPRTYFLLSLFLFSPLTFPFHFFHKQNSYCTTLSFLLLPSFFPFFLRFPMTHFRNFPFALLTGQGRQKIPLEASEHSSTLPLKSHSFSRKAASGREMATVVRWVGGLAAIGVGGSEDKCEGKGRGRDWRRTQGRKGYNDSKGRTIMKWLVRMKEGEKEWGNQGRKEGRWKTKEEGRNGGRYKGRRSKKCRKEKSVRKERKGKKR